MKFSEQLNEYISQLSCTAREVCSLSGISAAHDYHGITQLNSGI